jgi:hypothetical protein
MAVIANTFQTTSATVTREELADVVDRVDREDTPLYSLAKKTTFKTTHPEWSVDELASPAANAQLEGDEYTFSAVTPATRVGTYTQIMRKSFIISNSQNETDSAGRNAQIKTEKLKKGIELRLDAEYAIVDANASVGGATREMGSLSSWIETNVSRGATGANGGFNSGTGLTVAPTNGTQRAFTKALLDDVAQQGYVEGAKFKHLVVSPYVKSVFVTFMSDSNVAQFRYSADNGNSNSIVANADIYEGPFGKLMVHPNHVMAGAAGLARNAFLVDDSKLEFGWFRRIKEDKNLAKTGDATKCVLIGEGALAPKNEKGFGVIADVFGIDATT